MGNSAWSYSELKANASMKQPKISVIIPAHNEERHVSDCLDAILNQDIPADDYEVILVDNNSSDSTPNIAKSYQKVKYIEQRQGPVGAVRNKGVIHSRGEYLAFIDADCVAPRDWLSKGIQLVNSADGIALGGKYSLPENPAWIERYWLLGLREQKTHKLDLLGGTIFLRKTDFDKAGRFDESITSGEDSKLSSDLRKSGITVEVNQALNVIHLGNAKSVRDFIKRQAWHSENYMTQLKESIKDKTFILTCFFMTIISAALASAITMNFSMASLFFLISIGIASTFSHKRITRAPKKKIKIPDYLSILFIDFIYLIGRSIGIIRGLLPKQHT